MKSRDGVASKLTFWSPKVKRLKNKDSYGEDKFWDVYVNELINEEANKVFNEYKEGISNENNERNKDFMEYRPKKS